jgi:SH3-like domain-containing protein
VREKPPVEAKQVLKTADPDALNEIMKIEGDWLLIQKNDIQGWIKWRDEKGNLLIEIFYEA